MKRLLPHLALTLLLTQLLLMLVSWLCSAAFPASDIHSLLSGEGIRWLLGSFTDVMASPLLVGILLLAMAWGMLRACGILTVGRTYRERRALWLSAFYLAVYIGAVLLLTLTPHAVLLSASGRLWPSPFSSALAPIVAFGLTSAAWVYGIIAGRFQTLADAYGALLLGLRQCAPLALFYILIAQLYHSLLFVLP